MRRSGARTRASATASAASTVRSTGVNSTTGASSIRARVSRSSTRPLIRSDSASMRSMADPTSAESDTAPWRYSSAYPRTVASGVRSSCDASATNWRIRSSLASRTANDDSMRVSMTLRLRERDVTSSSAWRTGMRWVRSPPAMAEAVSSIRDSGRKARRTAYVASTRETMRASVPMTPVVTRSRVTVWLTVLRGMPTAKVAFAPLTRPATKRQRSGPDSEGTVNGSPLVTRGSSTAMSGRSGIAVTPVGRRVTTPSWLCSSKA